jgi:phosphoglycerate dehydrogenase-like enzyme
MKKVYVQADIIREKKKELEAISDQYEFVFEEDKDANIIIGNVPALRLKEFEKLEWIQTASVGVEKYIRPGILKEDVILTNAVGVHSKEVAEHIFAMIMNLIRKFYLYRDNQRDHLWKDEGTIKELTKLKVAIVGFGSIGIELAKLLKGLGIYVIGVKRTIGEKPDCVDELYSNKDMAQAIGDVDVVACVLPGNKENYHLFTADTFRMMRPDTVFINAGRGNLFSEETLKEVLDQKIIAALALDVFEKEPLGKESDLWDYPNLIITPHAAGSYKLASARGQFYELVEENLRRYISGQELLHIVKERES